MNVFEVGELLEYSTLKIQVIGGTEYIPVEELLKVLQERGLLALQLVGTPTAKDLISDFERGRFYEMKNLYEALNAAQTRTSI